MQAWFINEDGEVYQYNATRQEADFPNDFHKAYPTRKDAEEANLSDWL